MAIFLTNTLTRQKEELKPIHEGKVGLYSCGPTVYQAAHIGNFRAFLLSDILRRTLSYNGFEVRQVMNITDVGHLVGDVDEGEDKMVVAMQREGKSAWDIAEHYTNVFLADMQKLNMLKPHVLPRATEHIQEQINIIKTLEEKGFTYQTSDGIYFDTSKLPDYGKLSGQKLEEKEEGARVAKNPEKKNPTDFALWKFSPAGEKRQMEWESPWGVGFPGWHIECTAMSEAYLSEPFDIHTGGIDHIPIHHTNEIAQSKGAFGSDLAHVWMHTEFLQVDGGKMSKSLGNTYTLADLAEKDFEPLAFRLFTFNAHYRVPLNFTWEAMQASQNALQNLREEVRGWEQSTAVNQEYRERFLAAVNDDLDMPKALSIVWELVRDEKLPTGEKSASLLEFEKVLGLGLEAYIATPLEIPQAIQVMLAAREKARADKDWVRSDELRDEMKAHGYLVEDTAEGQKVRLYHG